VLPAPELSAIVLCYRAGEDIRHVIEPLHEELSGSGVPFEMVLVANYHHGQQDPTPDIVREFAGRHDSVVTVTREKHGSGMGWDMRSGFEAASGSFLIAIDGDAQNPTEDVLRMYKAMKRTGTDVMKGLRTARFDNSYRRLISNSYNFLFRFIFRTYGLWDINGKPKGLTRAAYEQLELHSDDWFIDAEIVIAARRRGLRVGEMPVIFRRNDVRQSFVRFSAILEFLRNMARYRIRAR